MKNFANLILIVTTCLLLSGFAYYFFAPLNWGAGELILHFHLWVGFIFTIYFIGAIVKHIKNHKNSCNNSKFVKVAYLLLGFYSILLLSGLAHFIPYISYIFNPLYYRFETYDLLSNIHLIFAIVVTIFLILHLIIKPKEDNETK